MMNFSLLLKLVLFGLCGGVIAVAKDFVVTEYGAIAGGKVLNTAAIQSAIEAAHVAGGGRVTIPEGVFRTGSLFLRADVEFHVAKGATLLGSSDINDYPKRNTRIEGHFEPWRLALLNAEQLDRVRISGEGTVDGNGIPFWAAFWQRRKENPECTNLEVERPRLLFLDRCRDVEIKEVRLRDSGFWNIHLYRCRGVLIEGVSITAPDSGVIRGPSTDGIDIDSSQDVVIRRTHISVGDDCIALKGTKGPLAHLDADSPPVENVLVEDCTFGDGAGVLVCGSEATTVRNITVRNIEVTGDNPLVRLKLRADTPQLYENILFENVRLSGTGWLFQISPWTQFFDLKGHPAPARVARNVVVRNVRGTFGDFGRIAPAAGDTLQDFTLENIHVTFTGERRELGPVKNLQVRDVSFNGRLFTP